MENGQQGYEQADCSVVSLSAHSRWTHECKAVAKWSAAVQHVEAEVQINQDEVKHGEGEVACSVILIRSECLTGWWECFWLKLKPALLTQWGCRLLRVDRYTSQRGVSIKISKLLKKQSPLTVSGCYCDDACGVPVVSRTLLSQLYCQIESTPHSHIVQRGLRLKWPEREQNIFA